MCGGMAGMASVSNFITHACELLFFSFREFLPARVYPNKTTCHTCHPATLYI